MKIHTLLITTVAIASLSAQETAVDPYVKNHKEAAGEKLPEGPVKVSICYEDFSLPLNLAATLQREHLSGAALYAKVLAAVGKDGIRQETFAMLRGGSGNILGTENVTENIYPTEFAPCDVSNAVTTRGPAPDKDAKLQGAGPTGITRTPATPSSFKARSTGFTMGAELSLSEDGTHVDLHLTPSHVTLVGKSTSGQEIGTTDMPIFESQSFDTFAIVKVNEPFLLGTVNRPPGSKQDADGEPRVWFAFVTARVPKP